MPRFKTGDLEPPVTITCTDNNTPVNLTNAVSVTIRGVMSGVDAIVDTTPDRDNAAGKVTHTWQAGETDEAGRYWFEAKVEWPGDRIQTFPSFGALAWDIEDD